MAGRADDAGQFLIRGENAPGKTVSPPKWEAPHPDTLPPPPPNQFGGRMWKMRNVGDWFGTTEAARRGAWMAEIRELVEGVPLTPFARVASAADFASPLANRHETGLGYINTDMVKAMSKDVLEKSVLPLIPIGRLGEPEEVARCVLFLASDDAGLITGSTLSANGGQVMV